MYVPCGEVGMVLDHGPSINGSRERVPLYHPLARPHAIPGMPDSNEGRWMPGGSPCRTAGATTMRLAGSVASADVLVG